LFLRKQLSAKAKDPQGLVKTYKSYRQRQGETQEVLWKPSYERQERQTPATHRWFGDYQRFARQDDQETGL